MRFTFLGTGTSQGIPVIACNCGVCTSDDIRDNRTRTSGMIESDTTTIVIDTGPDFRFQMLREKVKKVDAIVFTHPHKDHIAGLDDVRAFNFILQQNMKVYANALTIKALKREFAYAFEENKYPGVPQIDLYEIENGVPFTVGDITLLPIEVMHYKMPVLGFRVQDFAYITDANAISEESYALLKGTQTLVLNALRMTPHISHFSLEEAIAEAKKIGVKNAYFTHISHLMGKHADCHSLLPEGMELAYDGLHLLLG